MKKVASLSDKNKVVVDEREKKHAEEYVDMLQDAMAVHGYAGHG